MFIKKEASNNVGLIAMGFGILFMGLIAMTDAVEPLSESPAFADALSRFIMPRRTICVTGTNGKTTTCRILEQMLIDSKKTYFSNKAGANLITGITTSFILNSNIIEIFF